MRNCHNCGNMLDGTQKFCEKCGADVSQIIATASSGSDAAVSHASKPQKKLPVIVLSVLLTLTLVLCAVFLIGWRDEKGNSNYYSARYYSQSSELSDLQTKVGELEVRMNELNLDSNHHLKLWSIGVIIVCEPHQINAKEQYCYRRE